MQKTLAKKIKTIQYPWIGVTLVLFLLIFYGSVFINLFDTDQGLAWLWFLLCLLPGHCVIVYAYHKFKYSEITIPETDLRRWILVQVFSIIYLSIVFAVLLLVPLNNSEDTSYSRDLHNQDIGLLVLQSIFIFLFYSLISKANKNAPAVPPPPSNSEKIVFISYNHADRETAIKLKTLFEKNGVKIIIDFEEMGASEEISDFILRAMRSSHATMSIVSKSSLLSGWVAFETINSFFLERLFNNRLFIAGCIDVDFLDDDFTYNSILVIKERLKRIDDISRKQQAEGSDTKELNDERSRLIDLKHSLNDIVRRLKGSYSLSIKGDLMDKNFPQILQRIQKQ